MEIFPIIFRYILKVIAEPKFRISSVFLIIINQIDQHVIMRGNYLKIYAKSISKQCNRVHLRFHKIIKAILNNKYLKWYFMLLFFYIIFRNKSLISFVKQGL